MNQDDILTELVPIFRRILKVPDLELNLHTTAEDIPEWDSLNHAMLMAAIQNHFGARFSLRDILNFKEVGDVCRLLQDIKPT